MMVSKMQVYNVVIVVCVALIILLVWDYLSSPTGGGVVNSLLVSIPTTEGASRCHDESTCSSWLLNPPSLGTRLLDYESEEAVASCDGILDHYTNTSFSDDWNALYYVYKGVYDNNNITGILSPAEMLPDNGVDCSDFAHTTKCLADIYFIDCEFWFQGVMGRVEPEGKTHIGICCNVDSEWKCI